MASAWGDSWGAAWGDSWGVRSSAPPSGGKGDNAQARSKLRVPFKPTGILDRPRKPTKEGRKEVADRVDESRQLEADIAGKLAREFGDESQRIGEADKAQAIVEMSMAQVDREIAVLLRKKLRTEEDEMLLLMLMAAGAA